MKTNAETKIVFAGMSFASIFPDYVEEIPSAYKLIPAMRLRTSENTEDVQRAELACKLFYDIFAKRLLSVARKYDYNGAIFDPDVITQDTMIRAYEEADTIILCPQIDTEKENEFVFCQIFRMLRKKITEFHHKRLLLRRQLEAIFKDTADHRTSLLQRIGRLNNGRHCFRLAWEALSSRCKEILHTSYIYYDDVSKKCEIPQDVREALCQGLGISEGNLRTSRCRLVNGLEKSIATCERAKARV